MEALHTILRQVLEAPSAIRTRVVLLTGPQGVGRTTALAHLGRYAKESLRARTVAAGWTDAGDYLEPLLKFAGARLLHGHLVGSAPHFVFEAGVSLLSTAPGIKYAFKVLPLQQLLAASGSVEAAVSDDRFIEELVARLVRRAERHPMLALLDDAQHLDATGGRGWALLGRVVAHLVDRSRLARACEPPGIEEIAATSCSGVISSERCWPGRVATRRRRRREPSQRHRGGGGEPAVKQISTIAVCSYLAYRLRTM